MFVHEDSTHAPNFYVLNKDGMPAQITHVESAGLRSAVLPSTQLVHYASFDGKIISAFLAMPFNLKRDGSNPLIVLPHGGPTGQVQDSFSPRIIALVSRGYTVIAPNVRGSTGYGVAFEKANYQDLGGGDLQDADLRRKVRGSDRLCGPEEGWDCRRVLRRIHDADGYRQGAGAVGSGGRGVRQATTRAARAPSRAQAGSRALQNEQRSTAFSDVSFGSFPPEPISGATTELAESTPCVSD